MHCNYSSDTDMPLLLSMIEDGMPDQKCRLPPNLRDYYQFREHLYSVDGVILYKDRIVILPSLRQDCLLGFMQHIRAPLLWCLKQKHQSSGQVSLPISRPPEQIVVTVIRWHLPNHFAPNTGVVEQGRQMPTQLCC